MLGFLFVPLFPVTDHQRLVVLVVGPRFLKPQIFDLDEMAWKAERKTSVSLTNLFSPIQFTAAIFIVLLLAMAQSPPSDPPPYSGQKLVKTNGSKLSVRLTNEQGSSCVSHFLAF